MKRLFHFGLRLKRCSDGDPNRCFWVGQVGKPMAIDVPSDVVSNNFDLWMLSEEARVKAAQQVKV